MIHTCIGFPDRLLQIRPYFFILFEKRETKPLHREFEQLDIVLLHGFKAILIDEKHIEELQQTLLKDGCYLMGVKNQDPLDLAPGPLVLLLVHAE